MNKAARLALLLMLAPLAACGSAPAATDAPLAGAKLGGAFSLIDQDGRRVTDKDFAGRYRLMYFGYTFCPDVCPVDLQKLMQGYAAFEKTNPVAAAKLQPIFVTIDPARDTPAALKQYVALFHPRLIGLTGTEAEIAATAKAYAVPYQRVESEGSNDYLMDHGRQAILYGSAGEPIALVPQEGAPDVIASELAKWVN